MSEDDFLDLVYEYGANGHFNCYSDEVNQILALAWRHCLGGDNYALEYYQDFLNELKKNKVNYENGFSL